jgi:hypothetical protein
MIYEFDEDIRPLKRYFLSNNNLDWQLIYDILIIYDKWKTRGNN